MIYMKNAPLHPAWFVVSSDWHATHGISSRVIVRESHTGAPKNKQGLEKQTGRKRFSIANLEDDKKVKKEQKRGKV